MAETLVCDTIRVIMFRDGRADVRFTPSAFSVFRSWLFYMALHQPTVVPDRPYVCYLVFGIPRFDWEGGSFTLEHFLSKKSACYQSPLFVDLGGEFYLSCIPYAHVRVVKLFVEMCRDVGHDSIGNSLCYGRCPHDVPAMIVALRDLMIQCYADDFLPLS